MALTIPCKRFFFLVEVSRGSRLQHLDLARTLSGTSYSRFTEKHVSIQNNSELTTYQTPSQSARNFSYIGQLVHQRIRTFTARNYHVSTHV